MNLADKMEIFNDIEDQYLLEAMPKRLLAYGATRSENILCSRTFAAVVYRNRCISCYDRFDRRRNIHMDAGG